jgi:hypothetical protein
VRFLDEKLRPILERYNATERFGIALLHEPFEVQAAAVGNRDGELKQGYKLINFGNIAYPAKITELSPQVLARIVPTTYSLRGPSPDGRQKAAALPIEFSYSTDPGGDSLSDADLELFDALQKVLTQYGLQNVLGVSLVNYQGDSVSAVRFKRGANIVTLPQELKGVVPGTQSIPTLYVFPPEEDAIVLRDEVGGEQGNVVFDAHF